MDFSAGVVRARLVVFLGASVLTSACRGGGGPVAETSGTTDGSTSAASEESTGSEADTTGSSDAGSTGGGSSSTSTGGTATSSSETLPNTTTAGGTTEWTSSGTLGTEASTSDEVRPIVTAAPGTELVKIDFDTTHQTFEGWGTSLCWWAHHVGGWEAANRDALVRAVVDPIEGLGYNIFRYNIGGGENPTHEHMTTHREMPGFQNADGSWTWGADENQRAVLLGIVEHGSDLVFEAFSNSPPHWMTRSGCASGSDDGSSNLRDDAYEDFAHYLTEVVLHYRETYGVVFRTLEPLNEPFANWWRSDGTQEGCHFDPGQQERILQLVAAQLVEKGLVDTVVSGTDENSMDDALRNLQGFSEETIAVLGQINVHSYAGSRRRELRMLADRLGKRLWQSESGPLGQSIDDDTDAAIFMAARIIEDLRELEPEAWIDWQTGDPSRSWASFVLNDREQTFAPLKRFYMHAGFSRYIRPGAVFLDIDHPDMVAALDAGGQSVTVVVLNRDAAAPRDFTFDLTTLPAVGAEVEAHRTSRTEDLEALPALPIEEYRFVASAPGASITTFVIPFG